MPKRIRGGGSAGGSSGVQYAEPGSLPGEASRQSVSGRSILVVGDSDRNDDAADAGQSAAHAAGGHADTLAPDASGGAHSRSEAGDDAGKRNSSNSNDEEGVGAKEQEEQQDVVLDLPLSSSLGRRAANNIMGRSLSIASSTGDDTIDGVAAGRASLSDNLLWWRSSSSTSTPHGARASMSLGAMRQRFMASRRARPTPLFATPRMNPQHPPSLPPFGQPFAMQFAQQHHFINTETLADTLAAVCLLRTLLAFQADAAAVTVTTLRNFALVFVPMDVFVYQVIHMHDHLFAKPDALHFIYTAARLVVLFGLAWGAPSVFLMVDDNLGAFLVLLFCGKGAVALTHILVAAFDQIWATLLVAKGLIMVLPFSMWLVAMCISQKDLVTLFLAAGVALDVACCIASDLLDVWFEERRERLRRQRVEGIEGATSLGFGFGSARVGSKPASSPGDPESTAALEQAKERRRYVWTQQSVTRMIVFTTAVFVVGAAQLFQTRVGVSFADSLVSVKFSFVCFVAGAAGMVVLLSLHTVYANVFGWRVLRNVQTDVLPLSTKGGYDASTSASDSRHGSLSIDSGARPSAVGQVLISSLDSSMSSTRQSRMASVTSSAGIVITNHKSSVRRIETEIRMLRRSMLIAKATRWLHMPLRAAVVVLVAGMQLQLAASYQSFLGIAGFAPRMPVVMSAAGDFTGAASTVAPALSGVAYLAAAANVASGQPFAGGTSRLIASWPAISIVFVAAGAAVAVLAAVGFLSVASAVSEEMRLQAAEFEWATVRARVGAVTIVRVLLGGVLLGWGLAPWWRPMVGETAAFLGLAAVLVVVAVDPPDSSVKGVLGAVTWRAAKPFIVAVAALGAFVDIAAYGVIIPFLPQIVESYGGRDSDIGILLAFYAVGLLVMSPAMGALSDRMASRKWPMVGSLVLLMVATLLFMVAKSFWALAISRLLQGMASGAAWTLCLSLVADTHEPGELGVAMGIFFGAYSLGQLGGPPIGGILYARLGYNTPFIFCAVIVAVDLAGRLLIDERPAMDSGAKAKSTDAATPSSIETATHAESNDADAVELAAVDAGSQTVVVKTNKTLRLPSPRKPPTTFFQIVCVPAVLINLLLIVAAGSTTAVFEGTLSLKLRDQFGFDVELTGYVFMAVVAPGVIFTPLAGHLYDRFGLRAVSAVSMALAACVAPVLGITMPNIASFVVVLFIFATCLIFGLAPTLPEISACVPNTAFARTYGLFNMAFSVGFLLGPIVGSVLYSAVGWFWVCMAMCILLALCVPLALVYRRPVYTRE
ncbi:hypothetical protein HK105_206072 [Polyrhizophydium stewartii]|uniref:Major facilitator superfamily (MFS) profile domain-containing protein n=1 Tax=Polyrhizophydium stewartii TaxID=2732419 RepID=A0ABR4N4Q3_9FUNG